LLEKDFDKGTIRLVCDATREELDTYKEISGRMAELLGAKSDTLFSCSACIRQSEVGEISSGKKQITESLEEVVMGGKESTFAWQVVQRLDSKIADMKRGMDKLASNPGILASLKNKIQGISQRCSEVKEEVSKVEARKIELVEVSKQLAEVKERYENTKALLDNNEELKKIEESINGLREKYGEVKKRLDGINALAIKLEGANKTLESIEGFEDEQQVLGFRRRLNEIQIRRKDIENSLNRLQREVTEAEERLNKRKPLKFLSLRKSLVIAAIISIAGLVGTLIGPLYLLSLIILGMAFFAAGMWARSALASDRTEISEWTGRVQKMNKTLGELSQDEKTTLSEAGCSTVGEFDKKEMDFETSLKDKGDLEAQLKGMVGDKTVEDLQNKEQEIATDLAGKNAELTADLKATALSPEKHIEKKKEFQSLDAEKNRLEKEKMECEIAIKQARSNIEDQIRLEEELEGLQETLKHEDKKVRIYGLVSESISKARAEVLSSVEEALEKEIQKYLAIFTNNKYKQVRVDKEALEFWVYSDEKGGWARPKELSGGAIDEFYLAFRLALVKLVFGDKKPPLILDDPFVNFDSVRLANTLHFFKTLASDYQIIIFTLSDSYDSVADNIILLGERDRPL
jgi:DNA repair exonuclease SbcCD ATPase subunit